MMIFVCPICGSHREPQLIKTFPPKMAKCLACGFEGEEDLFFHAWKFSDAACPGD